MLNLINSVEEFMIKMLIPMVKEEFMQIKIGHLAISHPLKHKELTLHMVSMEIIIINMEIIINMAVNMANMEIIIINMVVNMVNMEIIIKTNLDEEVYIVIMITKHIIHLNLIIWVLNQILMKTSKIFWLMKSPKKYLKN